MYSLKTLGIILLFWLLGGVWCLYCVATWYTKKICIRGGGSGSSEDDECNNHDGGGRGCDRKDNDCGETENLS
ncbi:hypothetical protein L1987_53972 [Smallanthus sonchifolius]|uniref:Uncharacterized protein n=1 Tax=Smallanthus sonchifolius TaxID=185202 RepID=A0ACB9E5D2_9ASTR|nr:hypothetical protein L1987_53972 [Smallanthus sonchifolius]